MQDQPYTETLPNCKVIIEIINGRLTVYPLTNSDRETALVLEAIARAIARGELAA